MPEKLSAFLVGATGEVGKEIIQELARNKSFTRVTLFTRRNIDLQQSKSKAVDTEVQKNADNPEPDFTKFDQKIVNFDKLSTDHKSDFEGYEIGFCSLGTTKGKAGTDGFIKVDRDYVVDTAKLAKAGGCKHFNLVSGASANKNSMFLYPRVKGEAEELVTQLDFERLSIWRPGLLLGERGERRVGEDVAKFVAKHFDKGGSWSIQMSLLAKVMVRNCFKWETTAETDSQAKKVEILDNRKIQNLGLGLGTGTGCK